MNESKPVDVLAFLWGIRKLAVWGLLVAVLAGLGGLALTRPESVPNVKAIALVAGEPPVASTVEQVQRMNAFYPWTMLSFSRIATTDKVLAPVAAKHNTSVSAMQGLIGARLVPSTMLLELRYTATSPEEAKSVLDDIVASLQTAAADPVFQSASDGPVQLKVVQPATINVEPNLTTEADAAATSASSKSTVIRLVIVGGVALLLGLATMVGLALVQRRGRTAQGAELAD